MEKKINIEIPENLEKLAEKLSSKAELFVVGGYVRNAILGIGGTDVDLCSNAYALNAVDIFDSNFVYRNQNHATDT